MRKERRKGKRARGKLGAGCDNIVHLSAEEGNRKTVKLRRPQGDVPFLHRHHIRGASAQKGLHLAEHIAQCGLRRDVHHSALVVLVIHTLIHIYCLRVGVCVGAWEKT
eukprot:GCRY01005400.1.p1 GENE.GCRY01005400.1~~GCRY01005400.1.p1  ORF type:complete len:108 (+),score=5.57 GCRY01005400.1:595-918(+)